MPTWGWVLVALGAAVVGGSLVYLGWVYYLLKSFTNDQ